MSVDPSPRQPLAATAWTGRPPGARPRGLAAAALVLALGLSACSVLEPPVRPLVYDFGPGAAIAGAPAAALPVLSLAEVEATAALDSTALLYRLAFANAQQLQPYAQARWSMPPAQLLRQRVRDTLGQRRTVLAAGEGQGTAGAQPLLLRLELEEFSQVFQAPGQSVGLVRLRATLLQSGPGGERLLGQRMFAAQRPAPSADAPGGVRALTEATQAAVDELEQWLAQAR